MQGQQFPLLGCKLANCDTPGLVILAVLTFGLVNCRWRAQFTHKNRVIQLGMFDNDEQVRPGIFFKPRNKLVGDCFTTGWPCWLLLAWLSGHARVPICGTFPFWNRSF